MREIPSGKLTVSQGIYISFFGLSNSDVPLSMLCSIGDLALTHSYSNIYDSIIFLFFTYGPWGTYLCHYLKG